MTRIAISGHRGLSTEVTGLVDKAIRQHLAEHASGGTIIGLSCLADGADQLFARAVLDLGGHLEVVVPAEQYRDRLPVEAHADYDELSPEPRQSIAWTRSNQHRAHTKRPASRCSNESTGSSRSGTANRPAPMAAPPTSSRPPTSWACLSPSSGPLVPPGSDGR